MSNDVQRLQAAVIRVRAPADIGEQTGGLTITAFLFRLLDPEVRHHAARPVREFAGVFRRAGPQNGNFVRRRQQRVLGALVIVEQREQIAFAHAERGERNPLRLHDRERFLHGDRPKGKRLRRLFEIVE